MKIFLILTICFQFFEKKLELIYFSSHVKVYVRIQKIYIFHFWVQVWWTHQEHFKVIVPLLGGTRNGMVKKFLKIKIIIRYL